MTEPGKISSSSLPFLVRGAGHRCGRGTDAGRGGGLADLAGVWMAGLRAGRGRQGGVGSAGLAGATRMTLVLQSPAPGSPINAAPATPRQVGSIAAAVLIPHDNGLETALSYTLAAALFAVASGFFVTGFVVKGLQDE